MFTIRTCSAATRLGRSQLRIIAASWRTSPAIASGPIAGSTRPIIAGITVRVAAAPLNSSALGEMLLCAMPYSCSAATWRITTKPSASAPSMLRSSSATRSPNLGSSTYSLNRSSDDVLAS